MAIHTAKGIIQLYAGEIFILPRGIHLVEYHTSCDRLYEELLFTAGEEILSTLLKDFSLFTPLPTSGVVTPSSGYLAHQRAGRTLTTLLEGIREYLDHDIFDRCGVMARMKTAELVYLLLTEEYLEIGSMLRHLTSLHREPLEQFAVRHILSRKPLAELAREYGVGLSSFKREFREHLHLSPHQWFLARRLEIASGQLLGSERQVKAVAHECGFTSTSHFIRLFRSHYGQTPSQYRSAHQQIAPTRAPSEIKIEIDNIKNI